MKATKAEKVQTQERNDKWEVMDGIDDILFKKNYIQYYEVWV